MRRTLLSISSRVLVARSFSGVLRRSRAPASIEASGLRRSWPSTAMNSSRSSAAWRSLTSAVSLVASRSCASRWKPMRSAKSRNMPIVSGVFSLAGRGSIAQSVPKKAPLGRRIGIEM